MPKGANIPRREDLIEQILNKALSELQQEDEFSDEIIEQLQELAQNGKFSRAASITKALKLE